MSRKLMLAAAVGLLSTAATGFTASVNADTETATVTTAAAKYRPRQVRVEALGRQVDLKVPPDWTQTGKKETTGPTERVHYDWKNADENVTLTFVAIDPPKPLREALQPRDDVSLVRKMVIATFCLSDFDPSDIVVVPMAGRPNVYELTCTAKVRSRAANAYPRPHTLSTTMSRPLPLFHSRADVRSTSGTYVYHMTVAVQRGSVYIASAAAKVDGTGESTTKSAEQVLQSPTVTTFLTSVRNDSP